MITRRHFLASTTAALAAGLGAEASAKAAVWAPRPRQRRQARPVPSPAQLAWQRDELAMFLHFGVNTFTDREWGDGREDPSIVAPSAITMPMPRRRSSKPSASSRL